MPFSIEDFSREELSKRFTTIQNLLKAPPLNTEAGQAILLNLLSLSGHPLPSEPEYVPSCKQLQAYLNHPEREIQRLARLAISLGILSSNEEGKIIAQHFHPRLYFRTTFRLFGGFFLGQKDIVQLDDIRWQALGIALSRHNNRPRLY